MKNQIIGFIGFASCFTLDLHRFTFKFYFAPLGYLRVFFLFNTKGRNDIDTSYMCWLSLNGKKRLNYITVLFMSTQATFYFQSLHFAFQSLSISVFKEKYLINLKFLYHSDARPWHLVSCLYLFIFLQLRPFRRWTNCNLWQDGSISWCK